MGERRLCKPEVIGSSPFTSTKEPTISRLLFDNHIGTRGRFSPLGLGYGG